MRLSPEQIAQICQSAAESFGPDAHVWLFGSRLQETLAAETWTSCWNCRNPSTIPPSWPPKCQRAYPVPCRAANVDVLLSAPNLLHLPIHDVAFQEGKLL